MKNSTRIVFTHLASTSKRTKDFKTFVSAHSCRYRPLILAVLLLMFSFLSGMKNAYGANHAYTFTGGVTPTANVLPATSQVIYYFSANNTGTRINYMESFSFTTTGNVTSSDILSYGCKEMSF